MMKYIIKRKMIGIFQLVVTSLLGLSSVLLMNGCAPSNMPSGKKITINPSFSKDVEEVIVFCGNPGVGKSSLCNSIFQAPAFLSGPSLGQGMTQKMQEHTYNNKNFIDLPGLSDINLRKEAAAEITRALKQNKKYKLFFVATLESGRIKPDDLVTINTVCSEIHTNFEYGIIFNKVTEGVLALLEKEALKKSLSAEEYLKSLLNKQPAAITIIKKCVAMEDTDNAFLSASSEGRKELVRFLHVIEAKLITPDEVSEIKPETYEEQCQEMEHKLAYLQATLAAGGAVVGGLVGGTVGGLALGVPTLGLGVGPGIAIGAAAGAGVGAAAGAGIGAVARNNCIMM